MGLPGVTGSQSIHLDSWMGQDKGPGWGCTSFRSPTSKSLQYQMLLVVAQGPHSPQSWQRDLRWGRVPGGKGWPRSTLGV